MAAEKTDMATAACWAVPPIVSFDEDAAPVAHGTLGNEPAHGDEADDRQPPVAAEDRAPAACLSASIVWLKTAPRQP